MRESHMSMRQWTRAAVSPNNFSYASLFKAQASKITQLPLVPLNTKFQNNDFFFFFLRCTQQNNDSYVRQKEGKEEKKTDLFSQQQYCNK